MRNIATLVCAMLVFGVTVERSHADELPNLKDPKMISAGHALFLEKQCAHCHGEDGAGGVMGWPMLSAIVVNKENLASGAMEAKTLKGFIAAAKELRPPHVVTNDEQFLREQQKLVFEWGRKE